MVERKPIPHPDNAGQRLVPLTKGYFAVIDAVDEEAVGAFLWHASVRPSEGIVYARRDKKESEGGEVEYLHVFIGSRKGLGLDAEVDHFDNNGLNNTRENLRDASKKENQHNRRAGKNNRSGVKGLSWDSHNKKWRAAFRDNYENVWVGRFETQQAAMEAIRAERERRHGIFANHGAKSSA